MCAEHSLICSKPNVLPPLGVALTPFHGSELSCLDTEERTRVELGRSGCDSVCKFRSQQGLHTNRFVDGLYSDTTEIWAKVPRRGLRRSLAIKGSQISPCAGVRRGKVIVEQRSYLDVDDWILSLHLSRYHDDQILGSGTTGSRGCEIIREPLNSPSLRGGSRTSGQCVCAKPRPASVTASSTGRTSK